MTDLKIPNRVQLICNESAPIVKMVTTPDMSAVWVATSESSINCWVSTPIGKILLKNYYIF